MSKKLSLEIGLDVISSYKRLAYTPWHAIAEFVDNSTQSFFNNKQRIINADGQSQPPLKVQIDYDPERGLFKVTDNSIGMSHSELKAALHIAQPPRNTEGRSKYGMGLKTAACWIGNLWTVKTKKLGETSEHFVEIDVDKIASGNNQLKYSRQGGLPKESHHTIIEIMRHNRVFKGKTLFKIKQHLSSMYRQDFREGILELIWRGEKLSWVEFDDKLLTDYEGNSYKRNFDFTIFDETDKTDKRAYGWVGVLRDGSRSNAGFSILHADRVIKGWPDSWRPTSLYGPDQGSNDLVNQRLVGEIHLDEFDVSHTKDDILWLGEQEEKVEEGLLEHCADFRKIAQEFRKKTADQRGPTSIETDAAVSELQRELVSPELNDVVREDPLLTEEIVNQAVKSITESIVNPNHKERFEAKIGDLVIRGYVEEDMSPYDPYVTIDTAKKEEVIIIVNAAHPHWSQLRGSAGVLNYLRHCTYDGIAEWQARHKTALIDPETIKLLKDKLLRLAFDIERHAANENEEELDQVVAGT